MWVNTQDKTVLAAIRAGNIYLSNGRRPADYVCFLDTLAQVRDGDQQLALLKHFGGNGMPQNGQP